MIRKLVLAMTILALAAVPLPAWAARDGAPDGRHETRGSHEQFQLCQPPPSALSGLTHRADSVLGRSIRGASRALFLAFGTAWGAGMGAEGGHDL